MRIAKPKCRDAWMSDAGDLGYAPREGHQERDSSNRSTKTSPDLRAAAITGSACGESSQDTQPNGTPPLCLATDAPIESGLIFVGHVAASRPKAWVHHREVACFPSNHGVGEPRLVVDDRVREVMADPCSGRIQLRERWERSRVSAWPGAGSGRSGSCRSICALL
jgi:hypothetical protein